MWILSCALGTRKCTAYDCVSNNGCPKNATSSDLYNTGNFVAAMQGKFRGLGVKDVTGWAVRESKRRLL